MPNILIVEDDININNLLCEVLMKAGYTCEQAFSGTEAKLLLNIKEKAYTLVLLDLMLPGASGEEVLKEIRKQGRLPVIVLTAKDSIDDKIGVLTDGADDYITKPFEVKELLARIHAVMRRSEVDTTPKEKKLCYDKLIINLDSYELIVDGVKVDTPPKEMELLYHLAATPNRVYTRNQLLDEVWGFDYFGDSRTVDVHIKRLREKVENVSDQWALKTVWGVGYKFEVK